MSLENDQPASLLNDVAISLLQQHCYLQAFETFKEAMEYPDDADIEAACARLLVPEAFPKPPIIHYTTISITDLATTGKSIDEVFDNFANDDPRAEFFVNIRLGDEPVSAQVEAAVIEYNLGIAHQAYATALLKKRKRIASDNQFQTATLLLKTAEKTLANILLAANTKKSTRDYACRTLSLRLVVLLSLHKQLVGTPEEGKIRQTLIDVHAQIAAMVTFFASAQATIDRLQEEADKQTAHLGDTKCHPESARTA